MTREKFWEIVQILVQKDYWDAQSVPSKEVEEILTNSLLIPKPKFKVGDVTLPKGSKQAFQVDLRNYNLPFGNWAYYDTQTGVWWWEQELELVEETK